MNEASCDTDAHVRATDTAANQILGIKTIVPAFDRLDMLPHRRLSNDRKLGESGKLGTQVFRKSSGEMKVIRLAASVLERQDGD